MALTVDFYSSFFASFDIIAEQLYFVKGDFSKNRKKPIFIFIKKTLAIITE